jgi:hypothetical protein
MKYLIVEAKEKAHLSHRTKATRYTTNDKETVNVSIAIAKREGNFYEVHQLIETNAD